MKLWFVVLALFAAGAARADAVDALREFVRDVKSGRASFTQQKAEWAAFTTAVEDILGAAA